MLITGEAVALFAQQNEIPIPYTIQEAPTEPLPDGDSMSVMFARRKLLKPGRQSVELSAHSGLGMDRYAQVTSPLRRYLDLVIHQQLRKFLRKHTLLTKQEIIERIGSAVSIQRELRSTERLSRRHWTHAYLLEHPQWRGDGVVVEQHGRRYLTILPDLDLETDLYLSGEMTLDSRLQLELQDVNLPDLETRFRVRQQDVPDSLG
jgi:exoribonuclease-2